MGISAFLRRLFEPNPSTVKPLEKPDQQKPRWTLHVGDEYLGELVYVDYETPWVTADFSSSERFNFYRPYFDWIRLIDEADEDADEGGGESTPEEQIAAIRAAGGLKLRDARTGELTETTIHFDSNYTYATFR